MDASPSVHLSQACLGSPSRSGFGGRQLQHHLQPAQITVGQGHPPAISPRQIIDDRQTQTRTRRILVHALTALHRRLALGLRQQGLEGLMAGFVIGQAMMMMGMMALILRNFTAASFISFEFFNKHMLYPSLMVVGLMYNAAIWVDKVMFWYTEETSQAIIGPLRASMIYDLPVFLAYLAIIPGMAIFLLRMETDFVEDYDNFYQAVRSDASLETIEKHRNDMVETIRLGIFEIIKIQAIVTLLLIVAGKAILTWLGISTMYLQLLFIDIIAASLQVVLLGILNVFFYLDKRRIVVWLCTSLFFLNIIFTWMSLQLGPNFYGYGFAVSVLIVVLAGFVMMSRTMARLEYETFMLQ